MPELHAIGQAGRIRARRSVCHLPLGDVETDQPRELVRPREQQILLAAAESHVDDDVRRLDSGGGEHFQTQLLLTQLVRVAPRPREAVVEVLAFLLKRLERRLKEIVLAGD